MAPRKKVIQPFVKASVRLQTVLASEVKIAANTDERTAVLQIVKSTVTSSNFRPVAMCRMIELVIEAGSLETLQYLWDFSNEEQQLAWIEQADVLLGSALTFGHCDIVDWLVERMNSEQRSDLLQGSLYFVKVASRISVDSLAHFLSLLTAPEQKMFLSEFNYRFFRFCALNGSLALLQLIWQNLQKAQRVAALEAGDIGEYDALFSAVMNNRVDVVEQLYQWAVEVGVVKAMLTIDNFYSFRLAIGKLRLDIVKCLGRQYAEQGLTKKLQTALATEIKEFQNLVKPKQLAQMPQWLQAQAEALSQPQPQ